MHWSRLPDIPEELGLAGHFAGIHHDALIIAGGANFPQPIWQTTKKWHDEIYVLLLDGITDDTGWLTAGKLPRPLAYGASVSTPQGVVCLGGNDGQANSSAVFLLQWSPQDRIAKTVALPCLPKPCAYTSAATIGSIIYVAGGADDLGLGTAMANFWSLDMSERGNEQSFRWQTLPAWPGPPRALHITVSQFNGHDECVYVMSGRRMMPNQPEPTKVQFLTDVYEFSPRRFASQSRNPLGSIKIGANLVKHSWYVVFQMAEWVVPRALFREILERIGRLRAS